MSAISSKSHRRARRSVKDRVPCKKVTTVIDSETDDNKVLFHYGPMSQLVRSASVGARSGREDEEARRILRSTKKRFFKLFNKSTEHVVDKYGFCTAACRSATCKNFLDQGTVQMVNRSRHDVDTLYYMVNEVEFYPTAFFGGYEYSYYMILESFGFASDHSVARVNSQIPPNSYFESKDNFSEFQQYHYAANLFRRARTSGGRHPYAFQGMPLWHRFTTLNLSRAHEMFMYVRRCAKRSISYPDAYDDGEESELDDYLKRLDRISTHWTEHNACPQQLAMYYHYVEDQTNNCFLGIAVVNMMTQLNIECFRRALRHIGNAYGPLMDLGVFDSNTDVENLNNMFPCLRFIHHRGASYVVAPGTSRHNLDVSTLELYTPLPTVLCEMVLEMLGGPVTIENNEYHYLFQPYLERKACYVIPEEVAYYFTMSQRVLMPDKFPTRVEFCHDESHNRFCCTSVRYGNQSVLVPLNAYRGIEHVMFAGFMPRFQNGVLYFDCEHVIPSMTTFSQLE